MDIFRNYPLTRELHAFWRQTIQSEFLVESDFLSPAQYVQQAPKKFYSRESFFAYYVFLINAYSANAKELFSLLSDSEQGIDNANKVLEEINTLNIHDILLPSGEVELPYFIDSEIHFNLLKLYESCFYPMLLPVAQHSRIRRGKNFDAMEFFSVIEELKSGDFSFIVNAYDKTVRNGIAHGNINLSDREIIYTDKKGNRTALAVREVVRLFDTLIDVCNGFCLALKLFMFTHVSGNVSFKVPRSFLIEELKILCGLPGWKVQNAFDSFTIEGKKQLTIYIKNDNWDRMKVSMFSFLTAYWSEALTESYERVFLGIHSTHSLPGWASFDAQVLRSLRKQGTTDLEPYSAALEGHVQFVPRFRFPWLFLKIGGWRSVMWSIRTKRRALHEGQRKIVARDSHFHSKGTFICVADSSVVLNLTEGTERDFIKARYSEIVTSIKRHTRQQQQWYSLQRYLPIQYIRVFIYSSDKRVRYLRYSGLSPQLVGMIQINTSKMIKNVDLLNCDIEDKGKYRIYWHRNWEGNIKSSDPV